MANRVSSLRSRPYAAAGVAAALCVVIEREPAASESAVSDMSDPGDLPRIEGLRQLRANCATEWEWNGLWRAVAIAAAADLTMIEADRLRAVDGWELALAWLWGRAACPGDRRDAEITDEINFLIDGLNRGDLVATATRNKSRNKTPAVSPVTTNGDVPADYQAKLQAGPTSPASTAVINRARRGSAAAAVDSSAKSELPTQPAIAGRMQVLEEKSLKLSEIRPSPENPREDWDEAFLRTLGESLRDNGQLVPVTVRTPGPDGVHEIVDGETRYRAAKLVGLTELRVSIIECTDAEAALQRVLSYRQRRDLNPIEEARGLQLLIKKYNCTQRELENKVGISQGQISNRLRLLELPKNWQRRITKGEITGSDGRALAAWSDVPELFAELEHDWSRGSFRKDAAGYIRDTLNSISVELSGDEYNYMTGKTCPWEIDVEKLDEKTRQQLGLREIPCRNGQEKTKLRAFNQKLANKLVEAARSVAKKQADKRADKRDAADKAKPLSAAEKKQKAKQAAEQLERKQAKWLVRWMQTEIAERLAEANDLQLLAYTMHFVAAEGHSDRRETLRDVAGGKKSKRGSGESALELWTAIDKGQRGEAWVELLTTWIGSPTEGWRAMIQPADVAFIAADLDIKIARDWKLTEDYLGLHTSDQLKALCEEWRLNPPAGKRSELIAWMLEAAEKKPCPTVLTSIDVSKAK